MNLSIAFLGNNNKAWVGLVKGLMFRYLGATVRPHLVQHTRMRHHVLYKARWWIVDDVSPDDCIRGKVK